MSKLFWLCVLTILLNGSSFGADNGTLRGVVTDLTGAVIPNVAVRLVHWDTSKVGNPTMQEYPALKTGADGRYSIDLNPASMTSFFPSRSSLRSPRKSKWKPERRSTSMPN